MPHGSRPAALNHNHLMRFLKKLFGLTKPTGASSEPQDDASQNIMIKQCDGMIGDIARLLSEHECNDPVNTIELMVFGTFVISETYKLAKKGSKAALERVDDFHRNMANHFFNNNILKEHPETSVEMCFQFHDQLHSLMTRRYPEYRASLSKDVGTANTIFRNTVENLINNIMASPLSEKDSERIFMPLSMKVVTFYTGCLSSFKAR